MTLQRRGHGITPGALGDPKLRVLTAEEKQNLRKIEAKQTG